MQAFIDFGSDGVIIADRLGNILSWSEGTQRIFGYEESAVLGKSLAIIMPKQYQTRHSRALAQAATIRQPHVTERTKVREGLTRDGRRVSVRCATFSWSFDQETFFGAVVRLVAKPDQTPEMRQSGVDKRSLIERIPGFLLTLDRDGTILFINRGLMGRSVPNTIGRTVFDYIEIADQIALRKTIESCLETGATGLCLLSGPDSRGAVRSYYCQIGPIKRSGEFSSLVLIAIDATGREQMIEALEGRVDRQMARGNRNRLTHRELMVLNLGVEGRSVIEIGTLLGISQFTVSKHFSNILHKLGTHSRADAYVLAVRQRLVE